jgi:hypothetical protein
MATYRHTAYKKEVDNTGKMNRDLKHLLIIWTLVILAGIAMAVFIDYSISTAMADACPAPSFTRGIDKETGQPICGHVTGCPYGDSIPLGVECDKFAPVNVNTSADNVNNNVKQTQQTVDVSPAQVNTNDNTVMNYGFVGK